VTTDLAVIDDREKPFNVTLQIRAKHAALLEASRKLGSITALAEHLGVTYAILHSWISLKSVPKLDSATSTIWNDHARRSDLEAKLFTLTGQTLDELWPEQIRSQDFLDLPKSIEVTQATDIRDLAITQTALVALPSPSAHMETDELRQSIQRALKSIPKRHAKVLEKYFGLNGEDEMSFAEIAAKMRLSTSRVHQIFQTSLRRIQAPSTLNDLRQHVDFEPTLVQSPQTIASDSGQQPDAESTER